jgi:hopanoid C-3 methylase HpnR
VLARNREVFAYWRTLGLRYMFLGVEAIDEEGLKRHRKRVSWGVNEQALEIARTIGFTVAINVIADPDWDERRFAIIRDWALTVPEIVHLTVNTPYPGTETWHTESRRLTSLDYRLFDVQHAVLPTRLPLRQFYEELVRTQAILNRKHLGLAALRGAASTIGRLLLHGQTNFLKSLWKFSRVYHPDRQVGDHGKPVAYAMRPPASSGTAPSPKQLYVHMPVRAASHGARET